MCIETDSEIDISMPLFAIILIRQYRSILLPSSKAQAEVAFAEFPKSTEVQSRFCRTLAARLIGLKQIVEYRKEQSTDYKVRSQ